jgi:hypothetical protein
LLSGRSLLNRASAPSTDLINIGIGLVEDATRRGTALRLLGGVAVAVLCADIWETEPTLRRTVKDIDLAGYSRQVGAIEEIMRARGFLPAREFNALNAGRRLIYGRASDRVKVDIFLDEFRMCHRLSFANALESSTLTLTLTALLLTKLQNVTPTQDDLLDCLAIFLGAGIEEGWIDIHQITELCSTNWGWYRTVTGNLELLGAQAPRLLPQQPASRVLTALNKLTSSIMGSKKSLGWSVRASIGERIRWYETPEPPEFAAP